MPHRRALLERWLHSELGAGPLALEPASGDASFRRYWRLQCAGRRYVAMDAPPDKEDTARFTRLGRTLRAFGLHAPEIFAEQPEQGFLLLEDLGTRLYLEELSADRADRLYGDALGALAVMQACLPTAGLPVYDADFLRRELELFPEWLLAQQLDRPPTTAQRALLDQAWEVLIANALAQPRVWVHRDFHSRNLLHTASPSPGILDFQDAVLGPVTYDLVSLLRDCYIAWPRDRVEDWAWGYFQLAVQAGILRPAHEASFLRWFDLMGIQRHLKAAGIFARLHRRDGKPGYLGDIPRTLGHVIEVAARYPELQTLGDLIESLGPAVARRP